MWDVVSKWFYRVGAKMLPWGILALIGWVLDVSSSQRTAKDAMLRNILAWGIRELEKNVIYKRDLQSTYDQTLVRHQ